MKWRKKPIVIEAFQWTGDHHQKEDPLWAIEAMKKGVIRIENRKMYIETLEGIHKANSGDWIIKGIKNEIYPCKNYTFKMTYECVEEK